MFTVVITIFLSIFFLLFLGVMILGNKMSHTIESLQAKEADKELAFIDKAMNNSKLNEPENKKKK